jgi:hypothetical protein
MGRNIHEGNGKSIQSSGQKMVEEPLGSIDTPLYVYIISLYIAPIYIKTPQILFLSCFQTYIYSHEYASCHANFILFDFSSPYLSGGQYKLWGFSLGRFLHLHFAIMNNAKRVFQFSVTYFYMVNSM